MSVVSVRTSFQRFGSSCIMISFHLIIFDCELTQNGFDGEQEQSDLMREIEALGAQLKRSREELDKSHVEVSLDIFPFLPLDLL